MVNYTIALKVYTDWNLCDQRFDKIIYVAIFMGLVFTTKVFNKHVVF